MNDRTEYPAFKCRLPVDREADRRAPMVYARETTFSVWNLIWLAVASAAGLVLGHAIYLRWLA